jgi:HK97 family phage prohead protease
MPKKYDFSGYATRNDLKCTDGRTIRQDAFKDNHGKTVPLVWQHLHNDPMNVLGHALLENRDDGVYAYCTFNDSPSGQNAKTAVEHGDITSLSIYANELIQKAKDVLHGAIKEVSLVLAGANPGAFIDNVTLQHGDDSEEILDDEAIIYMSQPLTLDDVQHAAGGGDQTIQDIFDSFTEDQKQVVYFMVGQAISESGGAASHSDEGVRLFHSELGGKKTMKKNAFEMYGAQQQRQQRPTLSREQITTIFADAQKCGSLKESFLSHAGAYGITDIDYLFPDAKTVTPTPEMIARDMEWVAGVISGTRHTPFSRIKSTAADITADAARALGYVKGSLKKEEVISLLKRTTDPTTIYKKQKLDRDDIIDITDLDVVAFLKAEMRVMLDEELARVILIGDGRDPESADKISETNIRPIYTDNDTYAHHIQIAVDKDTEDIIDEIVRARKFYKGTGNPALYIGTDVLTDMLLLKEINSGRRLYPTLAELAAALRVSKIVEVNLMDDKTRVVENVTLSLIGILVNLTDYTVGADKGGAINMFDDFDIDYNQYKYLMETRCSGALTKPKSALVIEQVVEGN